MTVIWSFEISAHYVKLNEFIIADILNCLQSVVIFVIFVLHKNTRDAIVRQHNSSRGAPVDHPATDMARDISDDNKEFEHEFERM